MKFLVLFFVCLIYIPQKGACMQSFFDLEAKTIYGKPTHLKEYKGKTLLVVNVASKCGYTKQYEGLEKLYNKFKDKGFVILGFPSNDFGSQEPGTNDEIAKFCKLNFGVTFPLFYKGPVTGSEQQPIYKFLVENSPQGSQGPVKWNFEKFLINSKGEVKGRFLSKVEPESKELMTEIEKLLNK